MLLKPVKGYKIYWEDEKKLIKFVSLIIYLIILQKKDFLFIHFEGDNKERINY